MKRQYPPYRKTFLIIGCLFAVPVLVLVDLFVLKAQTTMTMVERIYLKEIRSSLRGHGSKTYAFIQTDSEGTLQVANYRPAQKGKYLLITRSPVFGLLIRLSDFEDRTKARVQPEWKFIASVAIITLLLSLAWTLKRFDPGFSVAAIAAHAILLSFLWVYAE